MPSVVVKVTCVPLCGGVPAASITCAMIVVVPLNGRQSWQIVSVMVEPDGASSGTRWQAVSTSRKSAGRRISAASVSVIS